MPTSACWAMRMCAAVIKPVDGCVALCNRPPTSQPEGLDTYKSSVRSTKGLHACS